MHLLRRKIPNITALVAFEAAARCESFTAAAEELGVTQAAISRRIKALEVDLGAPLFVRAHRRINLSEAGAVLFATVSRSFMDLSETVDKIKTPGVDLTVAASVAFAHFRLLPALSSFRALEPEINLRVISEDQPLNTNALQMDVIVRYGRPPFRNMAIAGSLAEAVVPVCAPAMADALRGIDIAELTTRRDVALIESANPESSWLVWSQWLGHVAPHVTARGAQLHFTSYSDAVYAAIDGQGVALGWTGLLERPLSDGRLVKLDVPELVPEEQHYILVPAHKTETLHIQSFARWMETTLKG